MVRLPILRYPDARLSKVSKPVTVFDDALKTLIADMKETMYAAPGVGLAAPQVNVHRQIIVIDTSPTHDQPYVLINPKITFVSEEKVKREEGCLSLPGIYDDIERPAKVSVSAVDENGQPFELTATDLLAVCIQHEMDHLLGHVFVDYLSPMKRNRIKKKLLKEERQIKKAQVNAQAGKNKK